MSLYAGGDWSGRMADPDALLSFCIVALDDLEGWNEACRALREELGMAQGDEFHGHEMRPEQIFTLPGFHIGSMEH